ncbi:hypothetical protein P8452_38544 [Trifolium repens]|nr:hypothetical protein P8452_38544 [Trifolium repens]
MKLSVKKARFRKEDQKDDSLNGKSVPTARKRVALDVKVVEGVSFKSLLVKGREARDTEEVVVGGEKKKMRLQCVEDLVPLQIRVNDSTLRTLESSMVGFLKNTVDFNAFQDRLLLEGYHEVKATKMGGNLVLIQSPCDGELAEVLKCNKAWWEFCFSKVVPWSPNLLSESRETWIQIFGIPLHAWEESSFKMLAGRFGVFLDFDEATIAKHRFDMARVKLRTVRRMLIDTVVQLSVLGQSFDVWVVEERCCCEEEGRVVEEEVFEDCSGRSSMNSGAEVWQGQKGELFSDGTTDSDKSEAESYQTLVDLHEKRGTKKVLVGVPPAVAVLQEEVGKETFPCQASCGVSIGEREEGGLVMVGQVEGLGESGLEIPRTEGVEVLGCSMDMGTMVNCTPGLEVDVSVLEEREVAGGGVISNMLQVAEDGTAPNLVDPDNNNNWNPFVDPCDGPGLDLCVCQPNVTADPVGLELEARELEGGFLHDDSFVEGEAQLQLSNLSTPSRETRSGGFCPNIIKASKKALSKHSKPPLPLIGAPLSMRIAMSDRPVGRRKKGESSKKGALKGQCSVVGGQPSLPAGNSYQVPAGTSFQAGESPAFELAVVLPFQGSGLNLLLNPNEGLPRLNRVVSEDGRVSEVEEAAMLLGIQKKVGFTFDDNETEIHGRLVELEKMDRATNVVRVSEDGF